MPLKETLDFGNKIVIPEAYSEISQLTIDLKNKSINVILQTRYDKDSSTKNLGTVKPDEYFQLQGDINTKVLDIVKTTLIPDIEKYIITLPSHTNATIVE